MIMLVKKLAYLMVGSVIKSLFSEFSKLIENSTIKILFELFSKTAAKTLAKISSVGFTNFLVHYLIYRAYKALNKVISNLILEGLLKSLCEVFVARSFKVIPRKTKLITNSVIVRGKGWMKKNPLKELYSYWSQNIQFKLRKLKKRTKNIFKNSPIQQKKPKSKFPFRSVDLFQERSKSLDLKQF